MCVLHIFLCMYLFSPLMPRHSIHGGCVCGGGSAGGGLEFMLLVDAMPAQAAWSNETDRIS